MDLLRSVTFGQYIPVNSVVHGLDPRTKILATFLLLIVVFTIREFVGLAVLTAVLAAVTAAGRLPPGYVVRSLRPVLWLVAIAVVLQVVFGEGGGHPILHRGPVVITRENLAMGAFYGYRLILLVVTTTLMMFTTSPVELTDGLERLLRPFRRLGVPAHELAMMMTIALRFIPTLVEETDKVMKAQMARGAEFSRGSLARRTRAFVPLLVPLFVSAFRRADALALAMEARCYRGGDHRTRMKELRIGIRDYIALAAMAVASVLALLPLSLWRAL